MSNEQEKTEAANKVQVKTKRAIHSHEIMGAMIKAGVIPDHCRRVVIDLKYDDIAIVYYEVIGDESLLDIDWSKAAGVAVRVKEAADDNTG